MDPTFYTKSMEKAIFLAEQGRYVVAPNPTVGAVLVNEQGHIMAEGFHQKFGEDHAEVACLKNARERNVDISQCALVVTLEPCHHYGKTPPCTKVIIEAGIKHVIIGTLDPNSEASGGAEYLRDQGIRVDIGLLEEECTWLIRDFLVWTKEKRPYIILKMASTLDGRIATRTGKSHYITSLASRLAVAHLRKDVGKAGGCVLVGSGTFFADNPSLNVRDIPCEQQPKAAIAVTSKVPSGIHPSVLVQERAKDSIFLTSAAQAASLNAASLREKGAKVYCINPDESGKTLSVPHILSTLFNEEKCPYILCEGGSKLASRLFELKKVDLYHQFIAPLIFADNYAKPIFDGKDTETLDQAFSLKLLSHELCESDIHLTYKPLFK